MYNTYGGAREGAGRPPGPPELKRNAVSVRLPQWLIEHMELQGQSKAHQIEKALITLYKVKAPAIS